LQIKSGLLLLIINYLLTFFFLDSIWFISGSFLWYFWSPLISFFWSWVCLWYFFYFGFVSLIFWYLFWPGFVPLIFLIFFWPGICSFDNFWFWYFFDLGYRPFDIFFDLGYRPFDIFFDLGYRPIDIIFDLWSWLLGSSLWYFFLFWIRLFNTFGLFLWYF
jgi:hypothetical protein